MGDNVDTATNILRQALLDAGVPEGSIHLDELAKSDDGNGQKPSTSAQANAVERNGTSPLPKSAMPKRDDQLDAKPDTNAEPEPKEPDDKKPPTLTLESVESIIDKAVSKFQSITDSRTLPLRRQIDGLQSTLNQITEAQESALIESLPEEERLKRKIAHLEKRITNPPVNNQSGAEAQVDANAGVVTVMVSMLDAVGISPDDKRIDWASDVTDMKTGMDRFISSVKKAVSDDKTKEIAKLKSEVSTMVVKLKKQLGVDRHGSPASSGGTPDVSKMSAIEKIRFGIEQERQQNSNQ